MPQQVLIYSSDFCPYCIRAKALLTQKGVAFNEICVDGNPELRAQMMQKSGKRTVPQIFQQKWEPAVELSLNSKQNTLGGDFYEVVLSLSVTVKTGEEVAFIAEVQQAGIFLIKGLDDAAMHHTLAAFCPNILFPYAREALDNLVIRGSFPALMLAPVNFDALYAQEMQRRQQEQAAS